ncbi:MAG: hypothetical protein RDV48_24065 [Candidatus Eremiobacteraeota bacterium]|nr:hypothetical protein [Candidatus Eremiobacteraeota bacterium]
MEMKHRIQEQIYEETRHMTVQQKLHYFREGALNSEFGYLLKREDMPGEKNSGKRRAL